MKKYRFMWLFGALIFITFGIYILKKVDISVLRNLSVSTVINLLILELLSVVVYAIGAWIMLRGTGVKAALGNVYLITTGGGTAINFVSNIGLGIPTRVLLYKAVIDVPISLGTVAVALETVGWFIVIGLITIIPMPGIWDRNAWGPSLLVLLFAILAIVLFRYLPKLEHLIPIKILGLKTKSVTNTISNFRSGIKNMRWTNFIAALAIFCLNYFIQALVLYMILREFGWQINIFYLNYILVLSILAGWTSPLPYGLGTRDISLGLLLSRLGIPQDVVVSTVLIQTILRTSIPLILGLISIAILGIDRFKNLKGETVNNS
ncbi:MAG: hypothetical protein C3F13_06590 [Anaerolineales bacterium]|nr:MAG: hypothetical protein C3F13_06590 [Anaerolineales bacterium]